MLIKNFIQISQGAMSYTYSLNGIKLLGDISGNHHYM